VDPINPSVIKQEEVDCPDPKTPNLDDFSKVPAAKASATEAPINEVSLHKVHIDRLPAISYTILDRSFQCRCPSCEVVVFENLKQMTLKQLKQEQIQAIEDQEARRITIAYKEKH